MAYQFVHKNDFDQYILTQFLQDRTAENIEFILENIEKKAIAKIKAKLAGRYDTTAIFEAALDDRHELVIDWMVTIIIYKFLKRNAARKIPSDYKDDYLAVMKDLEKVEAGKLNPEGLPKPTDANGDTATPVIHANRRTNDFYI